MWGGGKQGSQEGGCLPLHEKELPGVKWELWLGIGGWAAVECSGRVPRIQHFVCLFEPEVWCYCDRKWESWGRGGRREPAVCVPVKSLCPPRAAQLQIPTERRERPLCG